MASTLPPRSLALKVSHLLLTPAFEDEATLQSLDSLAELSIAPSSTSLRCALDRRIQHENTALLRDFKHVHDRLDALQNAVADMNTLCATMESQLALSQACTQHLLQHASSLRLERQHTSAQQAIIAAFLDRFSLSEPDMHALQSRQLNVGKDLFRAMDKVSSIRTDCSVLLSSPTEHSNKAGMDIMSTTAEYLQTGYQKISRWLAFQMRGFVKDSLEVSPDIREAIQRLKARPEMLASVVDVLAQHRSSSLSTAFIHALTRGSDTSTNPIELHAHDPTRYIGDMLAWLHQAMASEHEFLENVFSLSTVGERRTGSVRVFKDTVEEAEAMTNADYVRKALDRNLEGCGRPLRLRVLQALKTQEGSIPTYKIYNLLSFYRLTMERTIGANAMLTKLLGDIAQRARTSFFLSLESTGRYIVRSAGYLNALPEGLRIPQVLHDQLVSLKELLAIHGTHSLLDEDDREEVEVDDLLNESLNPVSECVERISETVKATDKSEEKAWDVDVFRINVNSSVMATLEPFTFTSKKRLEVEKEISNRLVHLQDIHAAQLLKECGLAPMVQVLDNPSTTSPISHDPAASNQQVSSALRQFYAFLPRVDLSTHSTLTTLSKSQPHLASDIHRHALSHVNGQYERLVAKLKDPKEKYEYVETMIERSVPEVRVLLGVEQ